MLFKKEEERNEREEEFGKRVEKGLSKRERKRGKR